MQIFSPHISVLRVYSMFLIIITHFLSWRNIDDFQIASVGVACFLFISGYLYGDKNIENRKDWIKNRIKRVLVPFWILAIALSIYLIVKGDYQFALRQIVESLFNLQGLHNVLHFPIALGNGHMPGLAHCWFLTIIMLCYIGVIFLKNSCAEKFGDNHPGILLLLVIALHIAFCFINIAIGCFVIFFVGYFFRRLEYLSKTLNYFFAKMTFVMLLAVAIRIVLKKIIDGDFFYDFFISSFSSNVCAIWCFIFVKWICGRSSLLATITAKKNWKWIDNMTYPLYLTHYMFLKEPFAPSSSRSFCLSVALFVFLTIVSAMILNVIAKKIGEKIKW